MPPRAAPAAPPAPRSRAGSRSCRSPPAARRSPRKSCRSAPQQVYRAGLGALDLLSRHDRPADVELLDQQRALPHGAPLERQDFLGAAQAGVGDDGPYTRARWSGAAGQQPGQGVAQAVRRARASRSADPARGSGDEVASRSGSRERMASAGAPRVRARHGPHGPLHRPCRRSKAVRTCLGHRRTWPRDSANRGRSYCRSPERPRSGIRSGNPRRGPWSTEQARILWTTIPSLRRPSRTTRNQPSSTSAPSARAIQRRAPSQREPGGGAVRTSRVPTVVIAHLSL
jgi:hypothetical protein